MIGDMQNNLVEQVLKTVRNYGMLRQGDSVLAAVSGGPDSVFLLHALMRLSKKLKLAKVTVCNMDHCLRRAESEEDSRFVRDLAARLGLGCIHGKVDVAALKDRKLSTEEAARAARYAFFADGAAKAGANAIATGHTIDDQAETVLMRLIKGSSLKGLVGIAPVREGPDGPRIVRPLFEIEKRSIVRYLDDAGIAYRTDSSNLEDKYFRNVVRREVVPFLERYNPRLKRSLFNLAEHLREDFEYIRREKSRMSGRIAKSAKTGGVEIMLKDIVIQPAAIRKEVLRDSLELAGGEVKKLSFRHWKEVDNLLTTKGKGRSVDLPGSIRVTRTAGAVTLKKI
jgi:tRNA(Ile)-lysidine synthase